MPLLIHFGDWQLDENEGALINGETIAPLTPRALSVLSHLITHRDEIVTHQALQDLYWPNSYSAEHGLHKVISEIRTALGDDPKQPRYIKTLPRRGYSFIHEVAEITTSETLASETVVSETLASQEEGYGEQRNSPRKLWLMAIPVVLAVSTLIFFSRQFVVPEKAQQEPTTSLQPISPPPAMVSIAVLPFTNMSSDPGSAYFGDGLSEDILHGLAGTPNISVRARTSSFFFRDKNLTVKEIGRQLGTSHVLEGSVRVSGEKIRVTAQLIKAETDEHLWSGQYDRHMTDIFNVQDDITTNILKALNMHLGQDNPKPLRVVSADAYNARLQAQFFMSRLDFDRAQSLYELATHYDPYDANAYAALSNLHALDVWFHRSTIDNKLPQITKAVDQALAINPDQTMAHASRLTIEFYVKHNYRKAIEEMVTLIETHPYDDTLLGTYRGFMVTIGRPDLALTALDRALSNNPFSADVHRVRGETLEHMGRYQDAYMAYLKAQELGLDVGAKVAMLVLASGRLENIVTLRDNMQAEQRQQPMRLLFVKARVAELSGEMTSHAAYLKQLQSSESFKKDLSAREDISLLAGDYNTAIEARRQRLKMYFPVFWKLPGSAAEQRDHPDLIKHPAYQQMLQEVKLDLAELQGLPKLAPEFRDKNLL